MIWKKEEKRATQTKTLTVLIALSYLLNTVIAQDYEVSEIECSFGEMNVDSSQRINQRLTAKLNKPEGFKGSPIFADERKVDPENHPECQIRPDEADPKGIGYLLKIIDLTQCGVLIKNGFINVRVWFPQIPGVVMMSDQEVIIMCKPPEPTITKNKAAAFAGALPPAARVSGIVEESPGILEYEVALFREASKDDASENEVPIDQAVSIGTKLQLRATINSDQSAWKYIKLLEVTVSPDAKNGYAPGHIKLVENSCRVEEFVSIVPRQPYRPPERPQEVRLEFEAILLDVSRDVRKNQLWIHAKIKACVAPGDCDQEFCLDLQQPNGLGRRKRHSTNLGYVESVPSPIPQPESLKRRRNFFPVHPENSTVQNNETVFTETELKDNDKSAKIDDNVSLTVLIPGDEYFQKTRPNARDMDADYRDLLDYEVEDLDGQKSKLLLTPPNSASSTLRSTTRKASTTKTSTKSFVAEECQTFLIIGGVLGSLLIVASLTMCYLAVRLHRLSRKLKRDKFEEVVRNHRRKYGVNDCVNTAVNQNPSQMVRSS